MTEDNDKIGSADSTTDRDSVADRHDRDSTDQRSDSRSESLREGLRQAWKEQTGRDPLEDRSDQERRAEPKGRAAREARSAAAADAATKERLMATSSTAAIEDAAPARDTSIAHPRLKKEVRERWNELSPYFQKEWHNDIENQQRGYEAKIAQYKEIDDALAPSMDVIKSFGHTGGTAVRQMMSWFNALQHNPDAAFPKLLESFGYSPHRLAQVMGLGGAQQQQQQQQQPALRLDPATQRLVNEFQQNQQALHQRIDSFQAQAEAQQMAHVNDVLAKWSADKPFFERVRRDMAARIGSGAVPLKNNAVDLDRAYEICCWGDPSIRAQLQAEQQSKAAAASREQAKQARYASSSLRPTSPGSNNAPPSPASAGRRCATASTRRWRSIAAPAASSKRRHNK
jgi:hypothetical protein